MGIKEFIQNFKANNSNRKEKLRTAMEDTRINRIVNERQKSADLRELEFYKDEIAKKEVKRELEIYRKERQHDIDFNYNALNAKNIIAGGDNILKDKKIFSNHKNIFVGQESCLKGNPDLLKNNQRLMR
jgi:hypothetical protein